jgi:stress response protein YsnF
MSHIVTALYDSREEAARALQSLRAEVPLLYADIYTPTAASVLALQRLDLTVEERKACEEKLATGDHLLLAQAPNGEGPEHIIAVLERTAAEPVEQAQSRAPSEENRTIPRSPSLVSEERLPIVEEELRVGIRTVVRGGASVRTRVEDVPVAQEIDLISESIRITSRPVSRAVSEQELEQAGLLRDRMFEIAQLREEAVVSKEVVVREEVVVSKTTERRVEQIHDTVRRTMVETEYFDADGVGSRGRP